MLTLSWGNLVFHAKVQLLLLDKATNQTLLKFWQVAKTFNYYTIGIIKAYGVLKVSLNLRMDFNVHPRSNYNELWNQFLLISIQEFEKQKI